MHASYLQLFRNVIDSCATDIFYSSFQLPLLRERSFLVINESSYNTNSSLVHSNTLSTYLICPLTMR
jgi:hypothetical protein